MPSDGSSGASLFLSYKACAEMMGISYGTFRNQVSQGLIKPEHGLTKFRGKRLVEREPFLAAWRAGAFDLERGRRKARPT